MSESEESTIGEDVPINRARLIGMKFLNSNMDIEVIYARIEKEGIPATIARKVAREIIMERSGSSQS